VSRSAGTAAFPQKTEPQAILRFVSAIPSGTVTLLFTDVQGSTRLWEAEPDPMARALRKHDEIMRSSIERAGGYVFKTVGDSFCAAFSAAGSALSAVLESQRLLGAEDWPTSRPVRVRMGLHSGVCEERDADYFGPVVNRAARLEAVAHGGQVLVSGATAELLSESLADGVGLRDLGAHRLKDLGRPEQVFQLEAEFLAGDFPPLASLDNPELPNNLPSLVSAFVGREDELAEVRALVASSRLVTLTGAGGSGKTRLALQAAAELIDTSPDGVWFAELAPATDGEQIAAVVAAALGLHADAISADSAVIQALAGQDALILLDNCEHVIDSAAKFCEQLGRHCPKVRVLATSREPLGIDGERVYRIPSLTLPPRDAETAEELTACDAVRLFAERARAHDAAFALDEHSAPLAATICRRLDGIPLALELAAARMSSMTLKQIADRLDQRFRLLTGGSRNAMPRQQTLQATVDWSFGLLTGAERDTLSRLSVFAGGFDLEAAEDICSSETVDALDVLDLLGSLVDKSLVVADRTQDAARYRLLETIRQYSAQELLRAAGEEDVLALRGRHAEHYLALAETAEPRLAGHGQGEWLLRLDADWDNIRAAITHFAADKRTDEMFRLVVALERFTVTRGHTELLDQLVPAVDDPAASPTVLLGHAMLVACGLIAIFRRKEATSRDIAERYARRALQIGRELGDIRLQSNALAGVAEPVYHTGDIQTVRELAAEQLALARQTGNATVIGQAMVWHGVVEDSDEERRSNCLEALAYYRQIGDDLMLGNKLGHLAHLDLAAGRVAESIGWLEQELEICERLGADGMLYFLRTNLALMRLIEGRHTEAASLARWCLLRARRIGVSIDASQLIFCAACCAARQEEYVRAARLHGAADADMAIALERKSMSWSPPEKALQDSEHQRLREILGDRAFDEEYRAGSQLTAAEAIELALSRNAASR
jgi:predicted ATPase/class 3 adenylate cyclase